jgi:hypothetical protein
VSRYVSLALFNALAVKLAWLVRSIISKKAVVQLVTKAIQQY